jgi:hypothetical protein
VTLTSGVYVRVLDLGSLTVKEGGGRAPPPRAIAEFQVSREPIARVEFTADGTALIVAHKDGHVSRVYRLRPAGGAVRHARRARARRQGGPSGGDDDRREDEEGKETPLETPAHVYDLRRGRTVGVIERAVGDKDGRWIALGTRNRTVHVYAVNPYGGKPDERSHMEGRVKNVSEMPSSSTDISPIVRLYSQRPAAAHIHTPLAFIFVDSDASLPNALLPPPAPYATPQSPTRSLPPSPAQLPISSPGHSPRGKRARNHQDVLLFDPADGTLSLRRITLERRAARESGTLAIPLATSISLPSTGTLARMTNSSPTKPSGLTQMMDRPAELVAREAVVATWKLKRGQGWKEVKHKLVKKAGSQNNTKGSNWNAQAELSTFNRSERIVPRTVYLVHQFSFRAFGEDYHALIRRFQLDVPTAKVTVRKQVEISPYPSGGGESFLHGGTAPRDIRAGGGGSGGRAPSSIEEPLSSALAGGLDYAQTGTPILPMLPNGTPGSYGGIRGGARPIRNLAAGIGEGVSEGLGRLRRSVRTPRTSPNAAPPSEPGMALEFDEADEDFSPLGAPVSVAVREPMQPSMSQETTTEPELELELRRPVTPLADDVAPNVDVVGEEGWSAWDGDDGQAVAEQERFDDIVVGFMDEEQQAQPVLTSPPPVKPVSVAVDAKRKKKGKK